MTRDPDALRHASAKSFRGVLGAPEAPPDTLDSPVGWPLTSPELALDPPPPGPSPDDPAPADGHPVDSPGLSPPSETETPRRPPDLRGVSFVLLLGADNRTRKVTGRTDSMIIAAFRHRDGKIAAFSVPRDLWVELPDVGSLREQGRDHARISSVVRVGEVRVGKGEGLPLLRRTLREQLGLRIDRYAIVDFQGFQAMVDEFKGVDVDVECPIMDCFWLDGPDQPCTMMTIDAGRQHMDGRTALQFVRSRHGTGDRDRTKRQQRVLLAFARKVRARGLRGLPALWRTAEPFVTTDMGADDAAYYASFAVENDPASINGFAIRSPMTTRHVTEDGKHVILLDRDAFDRALEGMFDGQLPGLRERKRCPPPDAALR